MCLFILALFAGAVVVSLQLSVPIQNIDT